jgi:hypothetical protein
MKLANRLTLSCCVLLAVATSVLAAEQWFKGNTHTHTWWSDGDSPPEMAVKWYKDHGYDFLVLSDHNVLSEGEKWLAPASGKAAGAQRYESEFADSVEKRTRDGKTEYRLKTLDELRRAYQEPGRFILVQGEEISDHAEKKPVHVNGFNLKELIPPQKGGTVAECIQRNIDAVLAQREKTGLPMFPHINHPNFGWAMTAEDLAPVRGEQFFEVHNGHPGVRNYGDDTHLSVERMWDVVLARRLGELRLPVMYGMATDDAHNFAKIPGGANPGRGWVMVQAKELTPEALVAAMEKGDFYATTGVTLKSIRFSDNQLTVEVDAKPGVAYKTQLIGTLRNYDRKVTTRPADDGHVIHEYSDEIGRVLAEKPGPQVSYKLTGDELYVRAKIISDAKHPNPFAEGDFEVAWTQPVQPSR